MGLIAPEACGVDAERRPALGRDRGYLRALESESIHIIREVVAEAERPVLLYSVGKDSAVLLHLVRKAIYPAPPSLPVLHVDTGWKFRAMYAMRDQAVAAAGMSLVVHKNEERQAAGVTPFTHDAATYTEIMKTCALKQALEKWGFDVAFGGARRDEDKSRAKERIISMRDAQHRWDPRQQRPELWRLYNSRKRRGESVRAFPLSNWTELDVWEYILAERIAVVSLYFAAYRPVVERAGTLIVVDDERMPLAVGEMPVQRKVRFRTLGCYPLTGAIESDAADVASIIRELGAARNSERQGRLIDSDSRASMERKKRDGYF
jgi:sulfate adenylyltransferase subunit 2